MSLLAFWASQIPAQLLLRMAGLGVTVMNIDFGGWVFGPPVAVTAGARPGTAH